MIIKNKHIIKSEKIISEVVLITKCYLKNDIISWVDHYLNWCGFNHIKIFDNESKCGSLAEIFKDNNKVTVITVKDNEKYDFFQQSQYNKIIKENKEYTYQFFCDDDEYLWFDKTKYNTINDYLSILNNKNIFAFAIPMVNISYNSNDVPQKRTNPMINECLYVNKNYNTNNNSLLYKSFIHINLVKIKPYAFFTVPHLVINHNTLLPNNTYVNPIEFKDYFIQTNPSELDIKLFHYYHRSYNEWSEKMKRTRIDTENNKTYESAPTNGTTEYPKDYYTYYLNPFNLS